MADPGNHILLVAGPFQLRGTCSYTMRLMQHLTEQGFSVSVVCSDASLIRRRCPKEVSLREYRHFGNPFFHHIVRYLVLRDLKDARPDLIHIQSRNMLEDGQWLARRMNCPYIVTIHDHLGVNESLRTDPLWCRKVIAVSDSVKQELVQNHGIPPDSIAVIHTGVDPPSLESSKPPLQPERVPVIGTAGPLEAVKGFPFFLSAAQQVLATGRDVEFLIAGAGPEEFNLRRLARDLGIADKVTFVPNLTDLTESLSAMDIFCLPSLQQGLGTIMLEPMALGKPVIASNVGGVYSVIEDNRSGLLVPPSDSQALAARILELLDDPNRARAIGQAGRSQVLENFRVDEMIRLTADLYREGLEQPAIAPTAASAAQ